jgi:hypothetical protein
MYAYPEGCSQSTHDRAFNESLSEPPDSNPIQADCKHWAEEDLCEWIDGKLVCPKCALLPPVKPVASAPALTRSGVVSIGPGLFVRTGRRS